MKRLRGQGFDLISSFSMGLVLAIALNACNHQLLLAQDTANVNPDQAQVTLFQAVILGLVQGLTEFLPISSTAHLTVIPQALGWGDQSFPGVAFIAIIQLGSIAAVISYFWQDLSQITIGVIQSVRKSDYKSQEFRMAMGIAFGTLPIVFFGLLIKKFVPDFDNSPLRSLTAIAIASIVMALLLALSEFLGTHKRDFRHIKVIDGIIMGCAQALAIIPGVSRSGSTLTAGLFIGLDRASAARFSFLLGIPAITLAGLVELKDVVEAGISQNQILSLIIGVISAAIFSYLAIAWLLRYLQKQDTWVFVWYRLFFGLTILGFTIFSNIKFN